MSQLFKVNRKERKTVQYLTYENTEGNCQILNEGEQIFAFSDNPI